MSRALPLNAIDTCVFIEAALGKPSDTRHDCERYLWRLGQTYRLAITPALVLELFALARSKPDQAQLILDLLSGLAQNPDTEIIYSHRETFARVANLLAEDPRLDPLDAFHAAAALEAGVPVLVTFDLKLLESSLLKGQGLRALHPHDALGWQLG